MMKLKSIKNRAMNKFNIKIEDCRIVTLLVIIMFMCGNLNVNAQSMNMDASEGEYPDKVKITWSFSGFSTNPSSVEIKRDGEQIGFVNNNVILYYDDNDAIPGIIHEYATIPHNEYGVVLASSDTSDYGFVFPNGSISGTVSSPYGAGVEGVIVEAEGWVSDGN
ncbi:MAG: hypothetical protein U9R19_08000, partial [Bacteroidota bacterium]|nr:hypothetical protein [Bacteroidota bacterium]